MHKFLSCSQNKGGKSLLESMRATSFRGCIEELWEPFGIKTKKSQKTLRLDPERKTRLEPTLWAFLASNIYTPTPERGDLVSLVQSRVLSTKKGNLLAAFLFVERKTRLELATPTLARLCSTN